MAELGSKEYYDEIDAERAAQGQSVVSPAIASPWQDDQDVLDQDAPEPKLGTPEYYQSIDDDRAKAAAEAAAKAGQTDTSRSKTEWMQWAVDALRNAVTGEDERTQLEDHYVDPDLDTGIPAGQRLTFAPDTAQRAATTLGQWIKSKGMTADNMIVELHEPTGRLMWKDTTGVASRTDRTGSPGEIGPKEGWSVFDPPGLDMGDLVEMTREGPIALGEGLGYMLTKRGIGPSSKLGKAIRAGVGLFGGAFAGEHANLQIAERRGELSELSEEEKSALTDWDASPTIEGAIAPAGAAAMRIAGGLAKQMFFGMGRTAANKIPGVNTQNMLIDHEIADAGKDIAGRRASAAYREMDENLDTHAADFINKIKSEEWGLDEFTKFQEGLADYVNDIGVDKIDNVVEKLRSGKISEAAARRQITDLYVSNIHKMSPHVADLMEAPDFVEAVFKYSKNSGTGAYDEFIEHRQKNLAGLNAGARQDTDTPRKALSEYDLPIKEARLQEDVVDTLDADRGAAEAAERSRYTGDVDAVADPVLASTKARAGAAAGQAIEGYDARKLAKSETEDFTLGKNAKFDELKRKAQSLKIPLNTLPDVVNKHLGAVDADWIKRLTQEDKWLLDDLQEAIGPRDAAGKFTGKDWGTWEQVARLHTQLRRMEDAVKSRSGGKASDLNLDMISDLRKAIKADRDAGMPPALRSEYLDWEKQFATENYRLWDGVLGKLVRKGKTGYTVADQDVVKQLFGPDVNVSGALRDVQDVITDPKHFDSLEAVKLHIFREFNEFLTKKVDIDGGERIVPKAKDIDQWIKERQRALGTYLSDEEVAIMHSGRNAKTMIEALTKKHKVEMKRLYDGYGGEENYRALQKGGSLLDYVGTNPTTIDTARRLLAFKHPKHWKRIQDYHKEKLFKDFEIWSQVSKQDTTQWEKVDKALNVDRFRNLETMFGKAFRTRMEKFKELASYAQVYGQEGGKNIPPLGDLELGLQAVFGPLSHPRYAFQKLSQMSQTGRMDRTLKMMLDPDLFEKASKITNVSDRSKLIQVMIGAQAASQTESAGATSDVDAPAWEKLRPMWEQR